MAEVVCKCGERAPPDVARRARERAAAAERDRFPRDKRGQGGRDPLQQKLDALKKKFDALVVRGDGSSSPTPATAIAGDSKETTESDKLEEHIKQLETSLASRKILPGDSGKETCESLEKQLSEAKRSLAATKPELTKHTNVGHRPALATTRRSKLEQNVSEQLEILRANEEHFDTLRAQIKAVDEAIALLNRELVTTLPMALKVALEVDPNVLAQHPQAESLRAFMESETFKCFTEVLGESVEAREVPKPEPAPSPFAPPPGE
ncbi:unnamed protein product, partial [Prorocentrum cordatum]